MLPLLLLGLQLGRLWVREITGVAVVGAGLRFHLGISGRPRRRKLQGTRVQLPLLIRQVRFGDVAELLLNFDRAVGYAVLAHAACMRRGTKIENCNCPNLAQSR